MAGCMKMISGYISANSKLSLVLTILFMCLPQTSHQYTGNMPPIIDSQDGEQYVISGPNRFCYKNLVVPTWRQTWTRIQVKVWSSKVFKVETVEGEEESQESERFSVWSWFQSFLRERHNETVININSFNKKTCFRVDPTAGAQYTIKPIRKFDIYLFSVFLSGVLSFSFAESLSRSQIFFYSAGMSTGMIASLIIVFFISSRFLPKKSPFYMLIVGGWSFSVYAIQLVCRNLGVISREHWHAALGYVTVVGFISFAVCYRYGPLVDEKSINISSWTSQSFGSLSIYSGIQIQQVAFAIISASLSSKNSEYPVTSVLTAWRKVRGYIYWKPQPRRSLTEEEYQKEAEEETRRASEESRKYCNSPEFSPWRAVSRLQSPKRFADFIEGSPHLMPNEVSVHAQEYGFGGTFFEDELFNTDDEDEEEELKPSMNPE